MARKTKEDALATRGSILDAAELLFVEQGVSRTTLQHIATAAGVTRGAIYWHFEDKGALFNAMMERAKLPLEAAMQAIDAEERLDCVGELRASCLQVFDLMMHDAGLRRAFEIATLKMEYVDEMSAVRRRRKENQAKWTARTERLVQQGIRHGQLRAGVKPDAVALGLYVLTEGLVRNWLMDPDFDLVKLGAEIIETHLNSLLRAD